MQTDMTAGKPMKMVLGFTIPVFLGNVFQQLYSMADAVIVGKFVDNIGVRPHKEYIRKKGAYEDIYCKFRRTLKYGN